MSHAQEALVTLNARPDARKRYQALKPWLELANLVMPVLPDGSVADDPAAWNDVLGRIRRFVLDARPVEHFPAEQLRAWWEGEHDKHAASRRLMALAEDVARAFLFCTGHESGYAFEQGPRLTTRLYVDTNGLIVVETFDPFRDSFLPAIKGIEGARIRLCPVCKKIFFAIRYKPGSNYGSKACSRTCNQVLRVRRWRESQELYEQTRKLKVARLRPEGK